MATTDNLVTLGQLTTSMTRVKTELDALDGRSFGGVRFSNNKLRFYATSDTTQDPITTVNLPEELFLDQVKTTFVPSFNFANGNYTGATNPNLDGKPVLVLAVKGDGSATNPTLTYSFVNLETLVDTYTPTNAAISIAGYSIGVQLSADAGNILSIANDGLKGEIKVTGATQGNIASFGTNGKLVDSGVSPGSKIDKVTNAVTNNIVTWAANGAVKDSGVAVSSKVDKLTGATQGNIVTFGTSGALADSGVSPDSKIDKVTTAVTNNIVTWGADGAVKDSGVAISSKMDKVTGATQGNIVAFGTNGALVDSGYVVASDAAVNTMLTSVFGESS